MAQDTALQVIKLQQLPIIVERLHSVKADIERRTAEATSLICTEETYKSVKDARAQLTKEFKEYEAHPEPAPTVAGGGRSSRQCSGQPELFSGQ